MPRLISYFLLTLLCAPLAYAQSGPWFLWSRHGECADINAALQHKLRGFPAISGPDAFAAEMQRRGTRIDMAREPEGIRNMVRVDVPEHGWSLIFVHKEHCQAMSAGPR